MGGKTDLERVVAYVPPEWKQELEQWAALEERSVSWVVAKLIERALQDRHQAIDALKATTSLVNPAR